MQLNSIKIAVELILADYDLKLLIWNDTRVCFHLLACSQHVGT